MVLTTLAGAAFVGLLVVARPELAVLFLAGAILLPIGLWSVPMLLAVWVVIVYLGGIRGLESVPNHFLDVVLVCALVVMGSRALRRGTLLPSGHVILPMFVAFVFWQALSMIWADDVSVAVPQMYAFLYIAFGFFLVLATIRTRQDLRLIAWAFVIGGVLSVVGGIVQSGGLTAAAVGGDADTTRFTGGAGDSNYLAAMLVPALLLAGGLAVHATAATRAVLGACALTLAVGLAATQSRGGLIALVVAFAWALVHFREQRRVIVGALAASLAGFLAFFLATPAAWERIVAADDGNTGSGRTDIWQVAWRITTEHPFVGIGLNQFSLTSPMYVREPGLGGATNLIVNQHIVVHNLFLQTWVETGAIGLALLLGVIALGLVGALRAGRAFAALGDVGMSALSRGVVVSIVGTVAASFFISNILSKQIWVLLAMGPVLLTIATAARGGPPGTRVAGAGDAATPVSRA